jgi:site-specific recombinase XerD
MKLGKLLLKGFQRKSSPKKKNTASHRSKRRPLGASRSVKLKLTLPKVHKKLKPDLERPASSVPKTQQIALRSAQSHLPQAPEAHPGRTQSHHLQTSELIRPGDSLKQCIEGFLLDQRSPHTRKAYGKDLKRFIQFLLMRKIERGVERLDRSVLIAYKESLIAEGLLHTTIDRHLATLRSFFRWLVDDGIIEKSPVENVRFLNPKRLSTTSGFTDDEVRKILAVPNLHTRSGAQHYAILMMLFYCGLRRSELCALRMPNLGKERGHSIVRLVGKGNTERVIVLIPAVANALEYYFKITGRNRMLDQPLFTPIRNNRTGVLLKELDPSMIFYIVTKYAKQAGIVHRVSPHSCRATAISNARDHNVPDRAIQEFAGWSTTNMITRYDKRKSSIEKSAAHAIQYGAEDRAPRSDEKLSSSS